MATKYLAITLFFSLVVILPVHVHYIGDWGGGPSNRNDSDTNSTLQLYTHPRPLLLDPFNSEYSVESKKMNNDYLWMYVAFVYLFTGIALYLILAETKKIIRIRQDYLGSQSTVTDRTIRLSGIPKELRTEEKIRETVEGLEIGNVDSVTLCKDWKKLDSLMEQRLNVLRKLEESWTVHLGYKGSPRNQKILDSRSSQSASDLEGSHEESRLLHDDPHEQSHVNSYAQERPTTRIWYGFLSLQSRKVDAIDFYEEKLRKLDEQIKSARKKDYSPTPLAFVTMDSPAACVSLTSKYLLIELTLCSKWLCKR